MNTIVIEPAIQTFVDAVRCELTDLAPDERREITDGLEADLTELVADQGVNALGDPVDYARELRQAAGLSPEPGKSRERRTVSVLTHAVLDAAAHRWQLLLIALPGDANGFLAALRPLWWAVRAWIALQIGALLTGSWGLTVIPGADAPGVVMLLVAIAFSVQLGRGKLLSQKRWHRVAGLRLLLLGLNVFAVVMVPAVANGLDSGHDGARGRAFQAGYQTGIDQNPQEATDRAGMYVDGKWVSNIYPYDAHGRPLVGVQLYNQIGQPLNVITQPEYAAGDANSVDIDPETGEELPRIFYPWTNGATQLLNVFPLPSRIQHSEELSPTAFTDKVRPLIGTFPLANVPPASLPGIKTGVQRSAR